MQWFYNLKLAKKLISSFALVLLLTAILSLFSIRQLSIVKQSSGEIANNWLPSLDTALQMKTDFSSGEIANNWLPSLDTALQMKTDFSRYRIQELQHILSTGETQFNTVEKNLLMIRDIFQKDMDRYATQIPSKEAVLIFEELKKTWTDYQAESAKVIKISRSENDEDARTVIRGKSTQLYQMTNKLLDGLVEISRNGSKNSADAATDIYTSTRIWILALMVGAIVSGFLLAAWVANIVSNPLNRAVALARRVASGDLTAQIDASNKDETGELIRALKAMNENLLNIVSDVRSGTREIATASTEIARGNLDLSARTEQQASSLEETASAMEELTSTVKQNAENAKQASQLAQSASEIAVSGGDVVSQVIETMSEINTSALKIVDIISVIDGIAFQTNILALNAAVEAARAGEQGRGFAVVASEVRSLAQRSAQAAREVKVLIGNSVEKVEIGSKLVERAGTTITDVVASVKNVTDIVGEISAASREQSIGIEQVNQAITQMDEVTQQNAALVEEAAASAQSMQEQADKLSKMVDLFKLNEV